MNTIEQLSKKGIFFIPAGEEFGLTDNKSVQIVYAPIAGQSFLVSGQELPDLQQKLLISATKLPYADATPDPLQSLFAEEKRMYWQNYRIEPDDCLSLTILPNHRCNFNCSYCYSAGGRSSAELRSEQITALVAWALERCAKTDKFCRVLFLGGGEPLLSWDTITESIKQIEQVRHKLGAKMEISISTNGSLLTADKISTLLEHNVSVQVSFEVLEDVQNAQRGHYDLVHANIVSAIRQGLVPGIHSVVTSLNLHRMEEVVRKAHEQYPEVKKLGLEPVVDAELLMDAATAADFYERFYEGFINAEKIAKQYGIELTTSYSNSLQTIRPHYCAAQITLTPLGTFSSCEAISNPKENGYHEAIFGKINHDGKPEFDLEAFRRYHPATPGFERDKCSSCWVRWNCGGGCNYKRLTLSTAVFDEYCKLVRKLVRHFLTDKIRTEYAKATSGGNLDALVAGLFPTK